MDGWRTSYTRYGAWQTARSACLRLLRRMLRYELCAIQYVEMDLQPPAPADGYTCRQVSREEFHQHVCDEIAGTNMDWAFDRGDLCVANLRQEDIVGYDFSTRHPTAVTDGVEFCFREGLAYGFAAVTAPAHRGKRLAPLRWYEVFRVRLDDNVRPVFYLNLANSASLKSNRNITGPETPVLGYTAYWILFGRAFCWRSPAARRNGVGFRRT